MSGAFLLHEMHLLRITEKSSKNNLCSMILSKIKSQRRKSYGKDFTVQEVRRASLDAG